MFHRPSWPLVLVGSMSIGAGAAFGRPQSPCSPVLVHDVPGANEFALDAAFDGANFLVAFGDDSPTAAIGGRLVSTVGTVGPLIPTVLFGDAPVVASGGGQFLLVDVDAAWNDVLAQFLGPAGTPGTVVQLTSTPQEEDPAGAAFDGANFLVVYFRNVAPGSAYLFGRRLSPAGALLGTELAMSPGPIDDQLVSDVVYDGANYLVFWMEPGVAEVRGRFVSPMGVLGPVLPIRSVPASTWPTFPAAAFDGANYLIVWSERTGPAANDVDVLAQRLSPAGALLGTPLVVTAAPNAQVYPFVAWDAASTRFLVTWTDLRNDANADLACDVGEATCVDVHGQFVDANGALLGGGFRIAAGAGDQMTSCVTAGGGTWLVTWSEGNLLAPGPGGSSGIWASTLPGGGCPPIVAFCFGNGPGAACPCGNNGAPGHGCANSVNAAGGLLTSSGTPAANDVILAGSSMPSTSTCIYLQGDASLLPPVIFGDGLRCTGGTLIRLRTRANASGASAFPDSTDTVTLSQRGAVVPGSGALRAYQTYYRNAAAAFCPPETFNVSNGLTIVW